MRYWKVSQRISGYTNLHRFCSGHSGEEVDPLVLSDVRLKECVRGGWNFPGDVFVKDELASAAHADAGSGTHTHQPG